MFSILLDHPHTNFKKNGISKTGLDAVSASHGSMDGENFSQAGNSASSTALIRLTPITPNISTSESVFWLHLLR